MPALFIYLFKISISLSVAYLFYHFALRKLTFYTWNRWYLLGYSFLSFFIAFFDISQLFQEKLSIYDKAVRLVPAINFYDHGFSVHNKPIAGIGRGNWSNWDWVLSILAAGIIILSMRLIIQYISFLKIRRNAQLFSTGVIKIYHVNNDIIPFSFGSSVFINRELHSSEELEDIIRHEFVHVKQKHSIDILWSELLCIINWYNPFTWLLKRSIRQNLEFIADNKVLENGINKKEYQYLLLKVIGNRQFGIASKFNFSSLKKRIAMMNKIKTARVHIIKFLFILPLVAILLVAFRHKIPETISRSQFVNNGETKTSVYSSISFVYTDTTPPTKKIAKKTELTRVADNFEITDKKAVVHLHNGKTEEYDLTDSMQRQKFEKNYGKIISTAADDDIAPVTVVASSKIATNAVVSNISNASVATTVAPVVINTNETTTVAATVTPKNSVTTIVAPITSTAVSVIDEDEYAEDVLVTITKNTTAAELEDFKKQMKEKGYELNFTGTTYNTRGILTYVSGTIKSQDGHSNFVASDFEKLILATIKKGDRTYFKIIVKDRKKVVI